MYPPKGKYGDEICSGKPAASAENNSVFLQNKQRALTATVGVAGMKGAADNWLRKGENTALSRRV